jgi:hypothetical protein
MKAKRTVPMVVGTAVLFLAITNSTTSLRGQNTQTPAIVGSWLLTPQNGKTTLGVVHADGTAITTVAPDASGNSYTDAVGAWTQTADNEFLITFVSVVTDQKGGAVGTLKIRADVKLDDTGDGFTAMSQIEARAPDGTLFLSQNAGSSTGKRIKPEPLQ